MQHDNSRLLRLMTSFAVGVGVISSTGNLAQGWSTGGPLLWSVGVWLLIGFGLLGVLWLLRRGQLVRAGQAFVTCVAVGTVPVVLLETPLGAVLVSTLGPLYAGLAAVAVLPPELHRRWRWGVALESLLVLWLRQAVRPLPSVDTVDVAFAGLAIGLATLSMVTFAALVIDALSEANQAKQEGLERLRRANQALEVAHDRALAASNAKAAFLAHMSHELRTPLNAVLGYTELLAESDAVDPTGREDLSRIQTAASHLLTMVSDVLDLSRVEAGQTELEIRHLDAARVCEEVATIVHARVVQHGNHFVQEVMPGACQSDPLRIRQILINLLENASRFTHRGTITLRSAPVRRLDRQGVQFEVEDTGTGIEPALLERIFEPFTTTDGTGIGLALARALAESLGGSLEVRSELGTGSCFRLWVPDLGQSLPPVD